MNTPDDGGPAFPFPDTHFSSGKVQYGSNGMTLRDYFAAAALQGMCANHEALKKGTSWLVAHAYNAADAMLAERNK